MKKLNCITRQIAIDRDDSYIMPKITISGIFKRAKAILDPYFKKPFSLSGIEKLAVAYYSLESIHKIKHAEKNDTGFKHPYSVTLDDLRGEHYSTLEVRHFQSYEKAFFAFCQHLNKTHEDYQILITKNGHFMENHFYESERTSFSVGIHHDHFSYSNYHCKYQIQSLFNS